MKQLKKGKSNLGTTTKAAGRKPKLPKPTGSGPAKFTPTGIQAKRGGR